MAANGLYLSRSALGAFLRRKKAHLGAPKAITATAHKLARLVYSMLRYGTDYVDKGQDYYELRYHDRVLRNLARNARFLGYQLSPNPTARARPIASMIERSYLEGLTRLLLAHLSPVISPVD